LTVVILQPGYLPWLGYFDQMDKADIFVHATDLQYTRQDWRNRNRIKTRNGRQWLTVPVKSRGCYHARIHEMRVNNDIPWARKHVNLLQENYEKAPYFNEHFPFFKDAWTRRWEYLLDLDLHMIAYLRKALSIRAQAVDIRALDLGDVDRTTRIIRTCQRLGATTYLSGSAGRAYLAPERFEQAGIALKFQDYHHPLYPQLHGEFISHLSVIDLLFNCGSESLSELHKR